MAGKKRMPGFGNQDTGLSHTWCYIVLANMVLAHNPGCGKLLDPIRVQSIVPLGEVMLTVRTPSQRL